jgi:hypothetical protein
MMSGDQPTKEIEAIGRIHADLLSTEQPVLLH